MIEALLHGKLSRDQENMEDILTSNVFGLMQFVPPDQGLFPFLAMAITIDGDHPLNALVGITDGSKVRVKYIFWPEWLHCEPDVVLEILLANGNSLLIVIEAKYLSGKSSEADEIQERPNDQLAREWADLVTEASRTGAHPVMVYLTADVGCPKMQLRESLAEYERKCIANPIVPKISWLSWRQLSTPQFCESDLAILNVLSRMVIRLGMTYFAGFTSLAPLPFGWSFKAAESSFVFRCTPIPFRWTFQK
jgi:hypothetical protein